MILKPVLRGAAAAGAVASAAGVVVVAAAFALYALFKALFVSQGEMAPAIASALVALLVAVGAGVGAALALRRKGPKPVSKSKAEPPRSLMDRVLEVARERPVVAAAGALGAGLIALRNPALIAAALGLFNPPPPPRR